MRFTAPVRMPLQTGATALKTGMFALMLIPFMWGVWPILVIFLMWSDARRRRASDIVFEEGGYRLEGGRLGGWVSAAWEQIDPKTVSVQETNELFVKVGDNPAQMIWRLTSDGDVLAESGDLDEIASMRVIATVIGEAAGVQPPPVTPTVEVHVCAGCRAPLVPVDAETMRCAFCGKDNPVPAELRREIQTAAAQDRAQAQMSGRVGRLLRHGRAHSANRAIRSFWWASQLVVPIGFAGLYFGRTAAPAIVMVAIAASAWALARVLVARRHALRALTLGCAAVTSFDPAKPPRCRRCLAPLPAGDATSGAATCTCAYCKAMNVLGVTLGETHRTVDESAEIADIMGKQRMATITSVAAVVIVTALAVFALR